MSEVAPEPITAPVVPPVLPPSVSPAQVTEVLVGAEALAWKAYKAEVAARAAKVPVMTQLDNFLAKVGKGFLAGVTSTDAVKTEKSLVVLILTRSLITAGASGGAVEVLKGLIH